MARLILIVCLCLVAGAVFAQGVKEQPRSVIIVTPPEQPSRPTAVPNVPPQSSPPVSVRRAYPYRANQHGSRQ